MQKRGRIPGEVAWLALAMGAVVLVGNTAYGALSCSTENANCAMGGPKRKWLGRVFTSGGQPADRALVEFGFDSNQPSNQPIRKVTITTDAIGRYCLVWPRERTTAVVSVADVHSSVPTDPRLAALVDPTGGPVIVSPDDRGTLRYLPSVPGSITSTPWDPRVDETDNCITHSPPWYRIDDLTHSWRYVTLLYLSILTIGTALVPALATPRMRPLLRRSATVLGAGDLALFVLIWIAKAI